MKLVPIQANMTELQTGQVVVLFSYQTPVAVECDGQIMRTATKYSNTTTRHINKWLAGRNATVVPQERIDTFVK